MKVKLYVVILMGLFTIAVAFFLLKPMIPNMIPKMVIDFNKFDNWTGYYTTIQSILTVITTLFALALGYFYYIARIGFENKNNKKERIIKRLEFILQELQIYDENVSKILDKEISCDKDLIKTKNKLSRSFENIILLLQENETLLAFKDEEIKDIVKVNSFVEKIIMQFNYEKISEIEDTEIRSIREEYIELYRDAKMKCFMQTELS